MKDEITDLFIIGGGINGMGIAADAAGRGLSVTLCEQNDFASGTSSKSSKLIHGGLRYLAHGHLGLVYQALHEREILLKTAPHLVEPLAFVMPNHPQGLPQWQLRLGLWTYDRLAGRSRLGRATPLHFDNASPLTADLKTGFQYYDAWTNDARLVLHNALRAAEHGAQLTNYTAFVSASRHQDHWQIQTRDPAGQLAEHRARVLINATGPWADKINQRLSIYPDYQLTLVKGSHLICPRLYTGEHAYLLQTHDARVVFVIPYEEHYSLVGTTEKTISNASDGWEIDPEEQAYLLSCVNAYFARQLTAADIVASYSGVRPLVSRKSNSHTSLSRESALALDCPEGEAPLLTVYGGKLTTYRHLAERALAKIAPYFPTIGPVWTAKSPLPGGNLIEGSVSKTLEAFQRDYPRFSKNFLTRLIKNYGMRAQRILQNCQNESDLGERVFADLYEKEIEYLITQEWVKTSDDLLTRRTQFGLQINKKNHQKLCVHLKKFF